jgi:hypothetical protein
MKLNWLGKAGLLLLIFSLTFGPLSVSPAYALSAPTQIAPANGSTTTAADTPPLGIPEFKWSAVSGATLYRLQVSSDIAFTSFAIDTTTTNTTYTPTSASQFSDGTWYWRVRVESPAPVSSYSAIWSFTKQWATPSNAPLLTAPENGATLSFYDQPVFSWGTVSGAARYKLQIYSSPGGWGSPLYNISTLAPSHQPSLKQANGTYYWRVVPVDPGNRDGTPSSERSYTLSYSTAPTLLEPSDFATPTFTPTFRWTAVRGAQYYRLHYTTDPSFSSGVTEISTRNTSYTPIFTLSNDVNYYWRVRVHSNESVSNWSATRTFVKKWYIKPVLLTPTNLHQHVRFPVFNWTPVPGASYYKVELSQSSGFNPIYDQGYTSNPFWTPNYYDGALKTYYWRVTPYDGNNHAGSPSNTSSYVSYYNSVVPQLVYPKYYYTPDNYSGFPGVTTNPHEDRTVALPVFTWNRVHVPSYESNAGDVYAHAYRIQVSTDATFTSINWTADTENLSAAPTASNPFTPVAGTIYYWRVRPLISGSLVGYWSQVWKTRFDPTLGLPPTTAGSAPTLIRPTNGSEFAETTPALVWFPVSGAATYDVQISQVQDFSATVDTATVSNSVYVPTQSLAQRNLGKQNFGIFYWRVRQAPSGTWSEVRRFQIAAQSQWQLDRVLGNAANRLQIGSDTSADVAANYDLVNLQASQSDSSWFFGFQVPSTPTQNVTYALYLDLDHQENSGATTDARGYTIPTHSAYRPEYAIYVLQESGAYSAARTFIYHWGGSEWDTVQILEDVGGAIYKSGNYVEVQLPNTAIGYQDTTGSYTVALLSLPPSNGQPQDSVPSNTSIPGGGTVLRFSNVTERMNLSAPFDDAGVDPTTLSSVPPFIWDWSILTPWAGAVMKAYLDPQFTSEAGTYTLTSSTAAYAQTTHAWEHDLFGDNTYYWRIQPRYLVTGIYYHGAWSQGWRFERKGFVPENLMTSVTFATPTFSWDMVEGAESYDLQVDDDPNFGSPQISINTRQRSYTDASTLPNATYYWRVRARRYANVVNNWTESQSFTLTLPVPSGLTHTPSGVVGRAPTLCWTPLIESFNEEPVLAAWKYRVQVSKDDPTFSNVYDNVDTEQSCWTPTRGYPDGQYYWRVAMIDGLGYLGQYSPAATFTKQYPVSTLVSPTSGANLTTTPTFVWTAVPGAARYRFESSQYSTFSPLYENVITDNTRWTPTISYAPGATYYWRVSILDYEGNYGPVVGSTIILDDNENPTPIFTDVPLTHWANGQIEILYLNGVTGGCSTNPLKYCPDTSVTRAQMAVMLLKAKNGSAYNPPNATGTVFADVPSSHWAAKWIEELYDQGITGGCSTNPLKYCPDKLVTREEMAVFILRMKYGNAYSPPAATGVFSDVPKTRWSAPWVEQLYREGITGGCATSPSLKYCPTGSVSRASIAVVLVTAFNLVRP